MGELLLRTYPVETIVLRWVRRLLQQGVLLQHPKNGWQVLNPRFNKHRRPVAKYDADTSIIRSLGTKYF